MTIDFKITTYAVKGHIDDDHNIIFDENDTSYLTIMPRENWIKLQDYIKEFMDVKRVTEVKPYDQ
jgi:hypothetical protein